MKKLITLSTATLAVMSRSAAYGGASDILTGTTSTDDLSRDIYIETLEAFMRTNIGLGLVYKQTIQNGNAGQFIIGGKSSSADVTEYPDTNLQVDVTAGTQDERTITLARPQYVARRVAQFEEKIAHYDIRSMYTTQMGEALAHQVDQNIFLQIEAAAVGTGVAGNPDGVTVTNAAISTGTTVQNKGDALAEAIFEAAAALRINDDNGEAYAVVSPTNYSYLVQSNQAVNADFTNGNGGFDTGVVRQVGGVTVLQSNNLPAWVETTNQLEGLVFTRQAVGVLELIGMQTNQETQIDFLDATLMTAYYAYGMGILRPESAVKIMSA